MRSKYSQMLILYQSFTILRYLKTRLEFSPATVGVKIGLVNEGLENSTDNKSCQNMFLKTFGDHNIIIGGVIYIFIPQKFDRRHQIVRFAISKKTETTILDEINVLTGGFMKLINKPANAVLCFL